MRQFSGKFDKKMSFFSITLSFFYKEQLIKNTNFRFYFALKNNKLNIIIYKEHEAQKQIP